MQHSPTTKQTWNKRLIPRINNSRWYLAEQLGPISWCHSVRCSLLLIHSAKAKMKHRTGRLRALLATCRNRGSSESVLRGVACFQKDPGPWRGPLCMLFVPRETVTGMGHHLTEISKRRGRLTWLSTPYMDWHNLRDEGEDHSLSFLSLGISDSVSYSVSLCTQSSPINHSIIHSVTVHLP